MKGRWVVVLFFVGRLDLDVKEWMCSDCRYFS